MGLEKEIGSVDHRGCGRSWGSNISGVHECLLGGGVCARMAEVGPWLPCSMVRVVFYHWDFCHAFLGSHCLAVVDVAWVVISLLNKVALTLLSFQVGLVCSILQPVYYTSSSPSS